MFLFYFCILSYKDNREVIVIVQNSHHSQLNTVEHDQS